jgi:hypothetical protein
MSDDTSPISNTIIHGDCIDVMSAMPVGSVDFILTDPPYMAAYKSRDRQTVRNDDNADWLMPSCAQMHRVLKSDAFAVSFYGWPKADVFFTAWKRAGFRIGGHIIFRKRYASRSAFLQYRHECACLLLKGEPPLPATPLPDVMDWTYSGNRSSRRSVRAATLCSIRLRAPAPRVWQLIVRVVVTSESNLMQSITRRLPTVLRRTNGGPHDRDRPFPDSQEDSPPLSRMVAV